MKKRQPLGRDTSLLSVLLLATVLHIYVATRAQGPARDGVGFVRYALQIERKPWAEVVAAITSTRGWHPAGHSHVLPRAQPV